MGLVPGAIGEPCNVERSCVAELVGAAEEESEEEEEDEASKRP